MKKILMIAYFFPPIGGSGVQRTLKFVKYLPEFHCLPVVSTVKNGHYFAYDESLLDEVPDIVKIYRSSSHETLWLRNIINSTLAGIRKFKSLTRPAGESGAGPEEVSKAEASGSRKSISDAVFNFIDRYLFIPDSKCRWIRAGRKESLRAALSQGADIIYSTSSPYSDHLIGLYVKQKTGLPWVADFRDPWIGNDIMAEGEPEYRKRIEERMERRVVENADLVINVTEPITQMYKRRYPEYEHKFITITNGFDEDDFKNIEPVNNNIFTICYTGILTRDRNPIPAVRALEEIISQDPEMKGKIKLQFIGFMPEEYRKTISQSPAASNVEILPYMSHGECLSYLAGSDACMVIFDDTEDNRRALSGKIFDYIGIERPILALIPDGVLSSLIDGKNIGKSVHPQDVGGIKDAILSLYNSNDKNTGSVKKCEEYSRRYLTKTLADCFEWLLSKEH